jgi:hypothetical protein
MKKFTFDHEPTFAELWDTCVYGLLYKTHEYKNELEDLLQELRITRDSAIIDVCAGGGFPAIELAQDGYRKARSAGISLSCKEIAWQALPARFSSGSFDFLLCRGNSFIYAGGGWNEIKEVSSEESLQNIKRRFPFFILF